MSVRVRFAPSPTGYLHVGGLRTALYNYLFARAHGGSCVVRIEDTDRSRLVADAEDDILSSLVWAGLEFDEGPTAGGSFGPYRQSERQPIYLDHAQRLVEAGRAYYAFDTPDELEQMRVELTERGVSSPKYDMTTRVEMRNSLTLSESEVKSMIADGAPHVIRLTVPHDEAVVFHDVIRGHVEFQTSQIDDQILVKSDGMPTYHLANVVDDRLMEITHVIRGEEWLPSTPKHILLYRYLGWEPPATAHLPLILSPTGGKLSKRKADKEGIPVLVREYREQGFEPAALVNYLAFLGWNPGTEKELFPLDELCDSFSLERVGSSGVQFDMNKLRWYNEQHLRALPDDELARRVATALAEGGLSTSDDYLRNAVRLMKERITFAADMATSARYLFEDPAEYDPPGIKKRWKDDSPALLKQYADRLEAAEYFDAAQAENILRQLAEDADVGAGRIIHPVRLALSGVTAGPGLFEMMELLGKAVCVRRLRAAVGRITE